MESFLDGKVELRPGDCREVIRAIPDNSLDSVVCDPPYALVSIGKRFGRSNMEQNEEAQPPNRGAQYKRLSRGFMGKKWDTGDTAFAVEFWAEVFRGLKPGGHVVAFSGTRTYHRMAVAIEDAGFEIRDQLAWMYGSGFPKSHDVSKGIDKAAGVERTVVGTVAHGTDRPALVRNATVATSDAAREWQGWGTALKPAWEPICLARKPLIGTVAENVLQFGTGALNVDGCRVGDEELPAQTAGQAQIGTFVRHDMVTPARVGRWPANILHDGSGEVLAGFPHTKGQIGGNNDPNGSMGYHGGASGVSPPGIKDEGSAARFFYTAKADGDDRLGSKHPTVKPVDLMQWLCRLVTPPSGLILDPFAGTGTTGEAAFLEGFRAILIEREEEYQADIRKRMGLVISSSESRRQAARANKPQPGMGIFEGL